MKKSGLSDVVSSVLIILIVLASVSIIAVVILRTVSNSSEKITTGFSTTRFVITMPFNVVLVGVNQKVTVIVGRGIGAGDIVGINIIAQDSTGKSSVERWTGTISELETKSIEAIFSGLGTITKVSIAPILKDEKGEEIISNIAAESSTSESEVIPLSCNSKIPGNENVLCLYNSNPNSQLSKDICDYYLLKRPGAKILGINIPDEIFFLPPGQGYNPLSSYKEVATVEDFQEYVVKPLLEWTVNHPEYKITHLAVAKDIPIKLYGDSPDFSFIGYHSSRGYLESPYNFKFWNEDGSRFNTEYSYGLDNSLEYFNPDSYRDPNNPSQYSERFAVSYLIGYKLEDIKKMIDKATLLTSDISSLSWVIDRDVDQFSVSEDDVKKAYDSFIKVGIKKDNILVDRNDAPPYLKRDNVIAYGGPGNYHIGYGPNSDNWLWLTNLGLFDFSVENRAIFASHESYNAYTFTGDPSHDDMPNWFQGKLADGFSSGAFGGTNYFRSFAGAAGHVVEPGKLGVVEFYKFFRYYAQGLTLAESALKSVAMPYGPQITVGDPLMRITDGKSLQGMCCGDSSDCISGVCGSDPLGVKSCRSSNTACVLISDGSLDSLGPEGTYNGEIQNGKSYCLNTKSLQTCVLGEWRPIQFCDNGYVCQDRFDPDGYASAACNKKIDGLICSLDSECISNNCDLDINGIKRCHKNDNYCVLDSYGSETKSELYACTDFQNKKQCLNAIWQAETISCEQGCVNGLCTGDNEFFQAPNTFKVSAGVGYEFTIPFDVSGKKLNDVILGNIREGDLIYFEDESVSFMISTYNGVDEGWDPNLDLKNGQAILYTPSSYNALTFDLPVLSTSVPISIPLNGRVSLITLPYCGNSYDAAKILAELQSNSADCYAIYMRDVNRGPVPYWSTDSSYQRAGIKYNFPLTNYGVYFIECKKSSAPIIWTPSCN